MRAVDVDKFMELQQAEFEAKERYLAARESGDIKALRAAANVYTAAYQDCTNYALTGVEPYSDR